MATTKITRTLGTPTNNDKWTYSAWVKRAGFGVDTAICTARTGTSGPYTNIIFQSNNQFRMYGPDTAGLNDFNYQSTRLFTDTTAWYHIVVAWDNTQATNTDRVKIYINGDLMTDFVAQTHPATVASGSSYVFNRNNYTTVIGARTDNSEYWDGEMAHINFVDGAQLTAASFGETDSATGIWKIKTGPSVTYGNNGFFLKMDDTTNMDLDSSGNSHTFATSGTLTFAQDSPSDNFAVFNKSNSHNSGVTFSHGNTTCTGASGWNGAAASLGFRKGQPIYWETKINVASKAQVGLSRFRSDNSNNKICSSNTCEGGNAVNGGNGTYDYFVRVTADNTVFKGPTNVSGTFATCTAGDIVAMSVNEAGQVKIYKNDSLQYTWSDVLEADEDYFPLVSNNSAATTQSTSTNFGNGYFGTTAVSSAGTNASGIGIFEYDVKPTTATALSTKGLNNT